ncbi:hypothetical protein CYMTET_53727 [Cymbomonas tetramitiformis]|uniref:Uncharacterized protein n=1 Tax=Cymbomonas tetramitiformis TaxID=36881 RepID=A0AAE0EPS5_9CHLO|nr:hypothetical protein CYMTET_53727 [Cymbomonas tetramitiformis]
MVPCRCCFYMHGTTIHHSLGRSACPATIAQKADIWVKHHKPAMHYAGRNRASFGGTSSAPPPPKQPPPPSPQHTVPPAAPPPAAPPPQAAHTATAVQAPPGQATQIPGVTLEVFQQELGHISAQMEALANTHPGTAPPAAAQPATAQLGQARQPQASTQSAQATPTAVPHQAQQQDPSTQQPLPTDHRDTQQPQQQRPTNAAAAYSSLPPPTDWSDEEEYPALRDPHSASQQWAPPAARDSLMVFHTPNPYHALQIEPASTDSPASHCHDQALQPPLSSRHTPQADPNPPRKEGPQQLPCRLSSRLSSRLSRRHRTPIQQARHSWARSQWDSQTPDLHSPPVHVLSPVVVPPAPAPISPGSGEAQTAIFMDCNSQIVTQTESAELQAPPQVTTLQRDSHSMELPQGAFTSAPNPAPQQHGTPPLQATLPGEPLGSDYTTISSTIVPLIHYSASAALWMFTAMVAAVIILYRDPEDGTIPSEVPTVTAMRDFGGDTEAHLDSDMTDRGLGDNTLPPKAPTATTMSDSGGGTDTLEGVHQAWVDYYGYCPVGKYYYKYFAKIA